MFEVTRENVAAMGAKLAQLRKFLDLPTAERRLAEYEAQMSADSFWNQPDLARKVIDESNALKRKVEPLRDFLRRVDDVSVLLDLGEAEPPAGQDQVQREADAEMAALQAAVEDYELQVFLT